MTQIGTLEQAEQVLATYIPQVTELLGKDLTLVRMKPMLELLGNPQNKLNIIHIAGTSGKTSTTYYIAALLAATGKKVGHTVSPYVDTITERVQVNMQPIPDSEFCKELEIFLDRIKSVNPRPTYFELLIAFVYWYFAKINVDYAVIETGMGGSFDATNVVDRQDKVCVITDIGMDHMHVLGDTLPEIAGQKAGIILPGNQVFMHQQSPEITAVFKRQCDENQAILNMLSMSTIYEGENTHLPQYQQRNWTLAKAIYDYIQERDSLELLDSHQLNETMHIQVPGRMDVRHVQSKTVIMDGAHNQQKMQAFVTSFQKLYPHKKAAVVLALKTGKEYEAVLPLLQPIASHLIITTFRAMQDVPAVSIDPDILAVEAQKHGYEQIQIEVDPAKAYALALNSAEDMCIITGSFYLLSCVRPLILNAND